MYKALYSKSVQISDLHWLGKKHKLPLKAKAQIRYRQAGQDMTLVSIDKAEFKKPQAGVASGQIIAIYKKKRTCRQWKYCLKSLEIKYQILKNKL